MRTRAPRHPALRPFVQRLWAGVSTGVGREWVLPTGAAHLVFRLGDAPLRLFDPRGDATAVGLSVLGGPRADPYLRALEPVFSVGIQLAPGALPQLLGLPADEVAGGHHDLGGLWGREAERIREQLAEASPERRLDLLEDFLLQRVRSAGPCPVVRFALASLQRSSDVGALAHATGYSHRHFLARFRGAVGLLPSTYLRLLRFQRALELHARGAGPWAEIAHAAGYADQAHLSREFGRLAGMTPTRYAAGRCLHPHHVRVGR